MSAPSASRWSAFSVRPPSASFHSVSATVSNRNAASRSARRPAGSVRTSSIEPTDAAPDRVGDLARAVGGHRRARPARPPARPGSGRTGRAARASGLMPVDASAGGHATGTMALPTIAGRPRRNSTHGIRRPPAGWTSWSRSRSPWPTPDRARRTCPAARSVAGRGRRPDDQPTDRRSRRTSRATAGRRGPGARARPPDGAGSSRPSSRRSGRVSVAPSSACGPAAISPRSHGPTVRSSSSAPATASDRLELRRRLVPVERPAPPGRRSARCRGRRPSGSA